MFNKYRVIQIVLLITIAFTIAACVEKSTLTVTNRTSVTQNISVDWQKVNLLSGDQYDTSFYLNDSIISPEEAIIRIEIPKHVWMQPKIYEVTLKAGKNKKIYLNFDRAGLKIRNFSEANVFYNVIINEVYYSKQAEADWSENILETSISSTGEKILSVPEDYEFIKLVDFYGEEYFYQVELTNAETTTLIFTGESQK